MVEIKFLRVDGNTDLPIPTYATAGAAGFDFRAFLPHGPIVFNHGQLEIISTGFCVEIPQGTELQIRPRSGLALKHGFMIPNSPGTVDEDYRGCVMIGLYYFGRDSYTISNGDRIAQGVISEVRRYSTVEVTALSSSERGDGGFGSTGVN